MTDAKWRGERLVLEHLRRRVVAGGYGDDAVSAATLAAVSCAVLPRVTCDGALVAYGDAHVQASRWKVHEEPRTLWASPEAWLWQRDYETSPSGQIRTRPCQDGTQPKAHELPCYATVMP